MATGEGIQIPMKLKVAGGKSTTKKKATTTKRTPAKKTAAAKRTVKKAPVKRGTSPKAEPTRTNRSPKVPEGLERKVEALRKKLEKQGDKRLKLHEDHKQSVEDLAALVQECLNAGMPMGMVHENAQISRQWIYKINSHSGRSDAQSSKPAPKRTTTRKPAAKKPAAAKRTVAKKTNGKKLKIKR